MRPTSRQPEQNSTACGYDVDIVALFSRYFEIDKKILEFFRSAPCLYPVPCDPAAQLNMFLRGFAA